MEQKNENEFLMLKNYNAFLIDLGLNISFSKNDDEIKQQFQLEKNTSSVKKIDDYVKEWQFKNKHYFISRNKNMSSKNILLLFEENNFIKIDQPKNLNDNAIYFMNKTISNIQKSRDVCHLLF